MQALFVDPRCIYLDSREGMDGGQGVAGRGSTDPGIRFLGMHSKGVGNLLKWKAMEQQEGCSDSQD